MVCFARGLSGRDLREVVTAGANRSDPTRVGEASYLAQQIPEGDA